MRILVFAAILSLTMFGCKDATRAQWNSLGKRHKIELYSCGTKIGEWISTGNPSNEDHSDGYSFMDTQTGKSIEISGTVIITQLD